MLELWSHHPAPNHHHPYHRNHHPALPRRCGYLGANLGTGSCDVLKQPGETADYDALCFSRPPLALTSVPSGDRKRKDKNTLSLFSW